MLKATRVRAVLLGLLTLFFVSGPAIAEVQNVKVGGELNVRSFLRKNLRLNDGVSNNSGTTIYDAVADQGESGDAFLQQLTALDVAGDLTENVKVSTRLINQRVWGSPGDNAAGTGTSSDGNSVQVSLANVTLKELFYSPLTLVLGRQRLWYGRGFIVGSRLTHGDLDQDDALAADEFSDLTGFDAARLIVDLGGAAPAGLPVTLDLVYAKVDENGVGAAGSTDALPGNKDDTDLLGLNVGTKLDDMNGEAEAYFFRKHVQSGNLNTATGFGSRSSHPVANTLGVRGSVAPSEASSVWGEMAYQWGNAITTGATTAATTLTSEGALGDQYSAWAMNLGADFALGDDTLNSKVGAEWIFYSGREGNATAINGWDPMYRGSFTTALREFQAPGFYPNAQTGATFDGTTTFNQITASTSNQHQLALHATVSPIEDLSIDNRATWFVADEGIVPVAGSKSHKYLGWEWDMQANYAYTDDVNVGLLYGLFLPGTVFRHPNDAAAQELVTSVNVKF